MKTVKVGIIGGGLMGREMASAFARWLALLDMPVKPVLTAVADLSENARAFFKQMDSVELLTSDYKELLASDVEVVYVAVPHQLHEQLYIDVLEAGKDLFAEKPFGFDLAAARHIAEVAEHKGAFVRCSSEFPFLPGAQRVFKYAQSGVLGRVLEVNSGFLHSSDLNPTKAANWKRQSATCGEIGVMGDLGLHALHVPLRLGWKPRSVYAQLSKGYPERPDGKGGMAACDTWDNAMLHTWTTINGNDVPMRFEMKRLAPSEMNSWYLDIYGTDGGVRYNTKYPKTLETFERASDQVWKATDIGFETAFKTITGGIFELGFGDLMQQMWASYLLEREGLLGDRFGCATVSEAVASQILFEAALKSQASQSVEKVDL